MDMLVIYASAIIFFLGITTLAFVFGFMKGNRDRSSIGKRGGSFLGYLLSSNSGESIVNHVLTSKLSTPEYHLLNNITLPADDGSTQIDHILVSSYGIFVIETKHYSGWIFANENSPYWTQVIYRVKNKFPSPLRQNYKHVRVIQQILDFIPKEQIHSLVVFTGSAEFKTEIPAGVIYLESIVKEISSYQEKVITPNRLQFCVGRIECVRYQISRQTDVEHQEYLNRRFGNVR